MLQLVKVNPRNFDFYFGHLIKLFSFYYYVGYNEVVEVLADENADVNIADKMRRTPLWIAAKFGTIK